MYQLNRIKEFLRLRRQNDDVKIATICVVIAAYCLINAVITGIDFYSVQNSSVSYEFVTMRTKDIEEMVNENNDILSGSLQKIIPIQFDASGALYDIECCMLSKEYLQNELGVKNVQKNVFYANRKAIQTMFKNQTGRNIRYTILENDGVSNSFMGQVIEIESDSNVEQRTKLNDTEETVPMIYCYGTVGELQDSTECIIKIRNHDIDGTIMMYLSENGFHLRDEQLINEENFVLNQTLLTIKYRSIITVVCFMSAYIILKKYNI